MCYNNEHIEKIRGVLARTHVRACARARVCVCVCVCVCFFFFFCGERKKMLFTHVVPDSESYWAIATSLV